MPNLLALAAEMVDNAEPFTDAEHEKAKAFVDAHLKARAKFNESHFPIRRVSMREVSTWRNDHTAKLRSMEEAERRRW